MKLHFFEDYIRIMFNQGKIETMFPNDKGNVQMCCPFVHTKKEFDIRKDKSASVEREVEEKGVLLYGA